jgi:hypothetical protein
MNLQNELTKLSTTIDAIHAERLVAERQHARLSSSAALAYLQPAERALAPLKRGQLIERISQIDRELAKAEDERKRLNAAHLAAAAIARKPSVKPTAELKRATGTVEDLEQRRETVATMIGSLEKERAKVILASMTGNAKAKTDADRMSSELSALIRNAADIELALGQAREQLKAAQVDAEQLDSAGRAEEAVKISAEAVRIAARIDQRQKELEADYALLAEFPKRLVRLRELNDTNARRIANPRVAEQSAIAAGLKKFFPNLGGAISAQPRTLEDSYRNLFPYASRGAGKAA